MKTLFKKLLLRFKKGNTNLVVAGAALCISLCALIISIQEVRIMRSQQKATMYPYLTLGSVYNEKGFGFQIKNGGNGLAKINSYKVSNDSLFFRDWLDMLQVVMPEAKNIDYSVINTAGNIRNQMITPGETVNLIFLQWTPETRELERRIRDVKITLCYSSLLDEYWLINDDVPIEIEEPCEIKMEEEFGF